jgi:hypothetical protein
VKINPLVAAGPASVGRPLWKKQVRMGSLAINIDRISNDIETLVTFSAGHGGVNRLTFSDEDRAARAYLRAQMVSVGFEADAEWSSPRCPSDGAVGGGRHDLYPEPWRAQSLSRGIL